jgi:hypothetical protein
MSIHKQEAICFKILNEHKRCLCSYRLYIREPNAVDADWGKFLGPFDLSLWLGIVVVIFVVSVLLEACHQLSRHFGSCDAERRYQPFLQDSIFHVFSAFCSQGKNCDTFVGFLSHFNNLL